ncbi:MAG: site-specific DNA-methyltransferase [Planctomycetota bacterium]
MKKLTPDDPQTHSADVVADNVERLRELFPEAFTEGRVDFDVLKQLLSGVLEERDEKYGLNWHGKRRARQLALTPSTGTLRPCPEESVDWDMTKNLMIEGDNLEVLKLLQKSYAGKVKLIYIDPPYNTGKDFVYPDDFRDNVQNYLELTGQVDRENGKVSSNTEASGRFHTDWLNMMFPRLLLARQLLRDDGIIVMSIDDAELQRLREVADRVFGEENFLGTLVWDRNRKNDARYFSVGHEYMLVYARNEGRLSADKTVFRGAKEGVDEVRELFSASRKKHSDDWDSVRKDLLEFYATIPEDDPRVPMTRFRKVDDRGPYRDDGNINWPGGGGPRYQVLHPLTKKPCKLPTSGWRFPTPERFWEEVEAGRIVFGPDESTVPSIRTNLFDSTEQVMGSVHFSYAQTSANQFTALFDGQRVFDNPKPLDDLRRLVGYLTEPDDITLDFFAGSGTFGHAVLEQNHQDGGTRRFILVQLPEPLDPSNKAQAVAAAFCDKAGVPLRITEITKERLRRAAEAVRRASPMFAGDLGYRVFKLDHSNIRAWDPSPEDLEAALFDGVEHLREGRAEQDVLYELLLKLGLDLCVPIEDRTIAGKTVHAIGAGTLFVCLPKKVAPDEVEELALGIAGWREELKTAGETTVVFRDSAFADDVAKTNASAILEQHGIENVRSL